MNSYNTFIHDVEKWPNLLLKSWGVHTARFLKYVGPFFNIANERVKELFAGVSKVSLLKR